MSDDLRELIARVSIRQRCCSGCHPNHIDYDLADALIDELIDLAGTGKLLQGIAEYRRPHV